MGFLDHVRKRVEPLCTNADTFNRHECRVCPLRFDKDKVGGDMQPTGTSKPIIYMLGEAPGADEVRKQKQFVGRAGDTLRLRIPKGWDDKKLRWNNCVRTRPTERTKDGGLKNRTPTPEEIESCRPSVRRDIEATKPKAIFGFGAIPLQWTLGKTGITQWAGRHLPVKIGSHTCWYFPLVHPSWVMRTRHKDRTPRNPQEYGSDIEFGFALDVRRAFDLVEVLPDAYVHTIDDAFRGVDFDMRCNDTSVARIIDFLHRMAKEKVVGLDYETNALRPYGDDAKILTVAISGKKETLAWPIEHREARWTTSQLQEIQDAFRWFLLNAKCRKVVHNLVFEMEWTAEHYGAETLRAGRWGCSQGQAFILDERVDKKGSGPGPQSLAFLCLQYFGLDIKALNPVDRKNLDSQPLDQVLRYNAVDARYHREVYLAQAARIKDEGLSAAYRHHLRRIPTVAMTQIKGIPIDQSVSRKLFLKYYRRREKLAEKIAGLKLADKFRRNEGYDYRPSAPKDIKIVLDKYLPPEKIKPALNDKGILEQVDEKTLAKIKHPICRLTVRWRKQNKVLSTYIEPVMKATKVKGIEIKQSPHIFPDGLAHPITNLTRVRTWRTSADNFNYQNWPKRDGERKEVRSQVALLGHKVVSFDYAGIQARNVAMESKDEALVKAFWDRYDIHSDWCERIVKRYPSWVKEGAKTLATDPVLFKSYRNRAKNEFVFPSFFGAQPSSLSRYLGIPKDVCEQLHEQFWSMFPDIKGWHKRITRDYRKKGYVTGLSGFRRRAPITPNELINAPIQADEAIIVMTAMCELSELQDIRFQANMEIHDDLTFIWPAKEVEKNAEVVIKHMLNTPYEWAHVVPIGVEMSVGDNWFEQKGAGEFFSDKWDGKILTRKEV